MALIWRLRRPILVLGLHAAALASSPSPVQAVAIQAANAGFEDGEIGETPPHWGVNAPGIPADAPQPYVALIDADDPGEGRASVRLERVGAAGAPGQYGALGSGVDASLYRGRRVRMTASVRVDPGTAGPVALWFSTSRANGRPGTVRNTFDRPIRNIAWADHSIEIDVEEDALGVALGLFLSGAGRAWFDDVRLEDIGPAHYLSPPDPSAAAYLETAIELLRRHHINSAAADWDRLAAHARRAIGDATAPAQTYGAIRDILAELGENHSYVVPAPGASPEDLSAAARAHDMPEYALLDGRFALVRVPGFAGGPEEAALYSATLREGLLLLDRRGVCGWIIDLRGNGGGNMWPMLTGLDPLLGAAPFGSFRSPSGDQNHWVRGPHGITSLPSISEARPAFRLQHADSPVALLLDSQTASSGETTAVAFIGRAGVRSFGSRTAGLTSAIVRYPMPDGAILGIATAHVRDRTGREYDRFVVPDEPVDPDAALAAALRWLSSQTCD